MHPDWSVTRCLVCSTVADGLGLALCLCDCCTTEQIHKSHIHRQRSALLRGRILYDGPKNICLLWTSSERIFISCGWELFPIWKAGAGSMWPLWFGQLKPETPMHSAESSYIYPKVPVHLEGFAGSRWGVNHREALCPDSQGDRSISTAWNSTLEGKCLS